MKSLLLTLFALPMAAHAAPEVSVGVGGGVMVMDSLEVLDTTWVVVPRLGVGIREGIGLELDLGFQSGKTRIGEHPYTAVTPRINLVGKIWQNEVERTTKDGERKTWKSPVVPLLAVGIGGWFKNTKDNGALGADYNRSDIDFLVDAGPGLMLPLGNSPLHLRTDLRWVLSFGNESYRNRGDQFINWEWTGGIGVTFGGVKDADKDGIVDDDDACKDEPEDFDEWKDEDGCPEPDNDEDGILDGDDAAPNDPEDMDGFEDEDGAPDPDNDQDGVLDVDDKCPDVAGAKIADGCPDADGDGILDADDECPDEAGPEGSFGCPDSDKDRVPTYRDACPDEPGPAKADPRRSDGCPAKVFVTSDAIQIVDKVFFDTGKATIKPVSFPLLDEIASTLKKFPGIKKVSVEGHTDNTGDAAKNQTLSEARAESVMTYLTETGGIKAGRLASKGFGQDNPLDPDADNDSKQSRDNNRRVEFNITEQERKTTEVRRPTLVPIDAGTDQLEMGELVATKTATAPPGTVLDSSICKAKITIDAAGKVTESTTTNPKCSGLARSVTNRLMKLWEFEPVMVEEKATAVTTVFTVTYSAGPPTFKHEASKLAPVVAPE